MTAIGMSQGRARSVGRRFYLVMSLVMAAVFVAGFSQTIPGDIATPGFPPLLVLHGVVFTLWVLLFVAQPTFVARGSLKLHRRIGMVGAGLAVAMVVMAWAATLFTIRAHGVPAAFPPGFFLVMNCLGILVFGGLVAAGVRLRKSSEWHKRLMLCATASILAPGLGRFLPMASFGAVAPLVMFAVADLITFAGPVADLIVRRRIHPAYYWGVGAILGYELLIGPLGLAPPTLALVQALQAR